MLWYLYKVLEIRCKGSSQELNQLSTLNNTEMKNKSEILKMKFSIFYNSSNEKEWFGRTEDTMEEIINKGFAKVYEAYSWNWGTKPQYKRTKPTFVPLHRIFQINEL